MVAVAKNGLLLGSVEGRTKCDRDVVLAAVAENSTAIQFADANLRGDKEIALAVVKKNGLALRFVQGNAKCDRDVVLAAVAQNKDAFMLADANLRADEEIAMAAGA